MGRQIKRERYRQTLITGTGGLRQEYVVRIHLHELSFFNHMKSTLLTVEFIGPHHFNAADQMIGELDQIVRSIIDLLSKQLDLYVEHSLWCSHKTRRKICFDPDPCSSPSGANGEANGS